MSNTILHVPNSKARLFLLPFLFGNRELCYIYKWRETCEKTCDREISRKQWHLEAVAHFKTHSPHRILYWCKNILKTVMHFHYHCCHTCMQLSSSVYLELLEVHSFCNDTAPIGLVYLHPASLLSLNHTE